MKKPKASAPGTQPGKAERYVAPSRVGKKRVQVEIYQRAALQLKMFALEQNKPLDAILKEALDLYLTEHDAGFGVSDHFYETDKGPGV